jgi:hypothetical protein
MKPFHKLFLFYDRILAITKPSTRNFSFFTTITFFFHDGILAIRKPFTRTFFFFHGGILAIREPFTRTFFFTMEFWLSGILSHELFSFFTVESRLSRSLFTNFSFTRWNFGYHGAFCKFFFHTMEFRLSWSLSRIFLSQGGISAITEPFTNFSFTRWNY